MGMAVKHSARTNAAKNIALQDARTQSFPKSKTSNSPQSDMVVRERDELVNVNLLCLRRT